MKVASILSAALSLCAITAGCAPTDTTYAPPSGIALRDSGIDPRFDAAPPSVLSRLAPHVNAVRARGLFVADSPGQVVELALKSYKHIAEITDGLTNVDGNWIDSKGNLYVANIDKNVVEYARGASSPSCTYSAGLIDPIAVTTDSAGNVFIVDYDPGGSGYVNEYPQCTDSVSKQYAIALGHGPEGVAVDSAGDIFVSYSDSHGFGEFVEFKGGSSTPTHLRDKIIAPAGLIVDRHGNLIADDQDGRIDVIPPPYRNGKSIAFTLPLPFHCSLNKAENLLFNANVGAGDVTVYSYPSGQLLTTLGPQNGINSAVGVAAAPDAAF
jgi:DNA-binding beta-propeller fold protein YncE